MSWFKPKSYLGVDIGAAGIKIVELKKEKQRPVLFTYGYTSDTQNIHELFDIKSPDTLVRESDQRVATDIRGAKDPLQDQVDHYALIIKQVCKEARTSSKAAFVSLPVSAVFHAVVTLPLVKPAEFDKLLRVEMKKILPYPVEEAALDYELIPSGSDTRVQRAVVNTVPKKLVAFYTAIFKRAGLELVALEPESVALVRSLVGRDAALSMVVDMGAERTNFFVIDGGHTITHQSIEVGGNKINQLLKDFWQVDIAQVEQMKRDMFRRLTQFPDNTLLEKHAFLEIFSSLLDPIVKEVESSFTLYLEQSTNQNKRPEKIIMTGGAGLFPYLSAYLAEKFTMKCYVGDPWGRVVYQDGLKSVLNEIGPRMAVTVGLALRGSEGGS